MISSLLLSKTERIDLEDLLQTKASSASIGTDEEISKKIGIASHTIATTSTVPSFDVTKTKKLGSDEAGVPTAATTSAAVLTTPQDEQEEDPKMYERAAGVSSNSNTTSTTATGANDVAGTDGGALKQQDDLIVVNAGTKTKYSSDISTLRTELRKGVDLSGCTKSYEQRSCGKDRRPSLPFVSGDTFRCLADIIFDETNQWKPSAEDFKCLHYLRTQESFGNKPFVVFIKTDQIARIPENLVEIDVAIPGPYILITHNSALSPSKLTLATAEKLPKLIYWYGQNLVEGEKRRSFPLGLENHRYGKMLPETYIHIAGMNIGKNSLVTASFTPRNKERQELLKNLESFDWVDTPKFGYDAVSPLDTLNASTTQAAWLKRQAEYKFVISPVGKGIDCHRTWEMIAIGVIPIVRSSILDPLLRTMKDEGLVLIVNNWEKLSQQLLENHWAQFGEKILLKRGGWSHRNDNVLSTNYWVENLKRNQGQLSTSQTTHSFNEGENKLLDDIKAKTNYVVISTSIDTTARNEDYAFMAGIAALNWYSKGFIPIIIAVLTGETRENGFEKVAKLWNDILPKNAIVIPFTVDHENIVITIAQIIRLYAVHLPELGALDDRSFLRITDADSLVFDKDRFHEDPKSEFDIDIFNGKALLEAGKNTIRGGETCNQYPMHSVGMKVGLWKKLFPITANVTLLESLQSKIIDVFGRLPKGMRHGGNGWYMDQILLGCVIDNVINHRSSEIKTNLAEGPHNERLHVGGRISNNYVDAHLANFRLTDHSRWFLDLVNGTDLFQNQEEKIRHFHSAWTNYTTHQNVRTDKE